MEIFSLTQKVDIIVDEPDKKHRRIYYSRIEDIGEDSLTIAAPYRRGMYLPPSPRRSLTARVTAGNCAYLFKSGLIRYITEPIPMWIITRPTEITKVQMRNFVRLDIVLDIHLELIEEKPAAENPVIATLTRDISAGGLRAVFTRPVIAGTKVKITLPLPDDAAVIEAAGEIVRVIPPDAVGDKQTVAIEFTNISEKTRGQIVKYIFRKQVERRKKEKELFD